MKGHRSHTQAATPRRRLIASAGALAALAALAVPVLAPGPGEAATAKGPVVSAKTSSLGRILVGPNGHTLYLFENDTKAKSTCAGMCATFWPPLITAGKPVAGAGVKASLIGTITRADGRRQVTYNHHPLYAFAQDVKKGQTNGEAVNAFGAEWYVTSPAGAKVEKAAGSSGGAAAPSPGGYTY
jgi:predicted lipoprotein with Yx(FWY)xxD motif